MKIEWWKFIPGYDYKYMVSDQGRVLSLNYNRTGKIKIMCQNKNTAGYLCVHLSKNNKEEKARVHRLVANAFISNPNNYPQINHKNEIITDNRVENLEWCDAKYNVNYGTRNERVSNTLMNNRYFSKPVVQYTVHGEFVKKYPSIGQAVRETGISQSSISNCCIGKRKTAGTNGIKYIWRYENRDFV